MRVLMVDDERYIAEAVQQVLRKHHFTVDLAFDGEDGLNCALSGIYDAIVLDIMLPKLDGLRVLRQLRDEGTSTPVILLTARGATEDRVNGLNLGADDYLAKPFHTDELLARLHALLRREPVLNHDGVIRFGDISLNPHLLLLRCGNDECRLTLKESQLLELLIKRRGVIVSKEAIIEKLWGYDTDAEDSRVETHVSLLRKKLAQLGTDAQLSTVRGAGYVLKPPREDAHV